jgi:hypothetical protein
MSRRRSIRISGALMIMGALAIALPGCGDSNAHQTNANGEVKIVDPVNPKPGYIPAQDEYKQMAPAGKSK